MNDLFSIVMPAFNSEKFIRQAIDSVVSQTYDNWELVIVDDGSTDSTGIICDDYADSDKRIKVIHRKNGGTLKAIQTGFEAVRGSFVCPVASDDWIDSDFLAYLSARLDEHPSADIICYEYYSHSPDKWETEGVKNTSIEKFFGNDDDRMVSSDTFLDFVFRSTFFGEIKCIKRSVIIYTEHELESFENRNTYFNSDVYQMIPIICNAKSVLLTCRGLYHYRLRNESISHSSSNTDKQVGCILDCMDYVSTTLTKRGRMNAMRRSMLFSEALRQLIDKMQLIIRKQGLIPDYRSIREHAFYREMDRYFGNKELVGACVDVKLPIVPTVITYKLFKAIVAIRS